MKEMILQTQVKGHNLRKKVMKRKRCFHVQVHEMIPYFQGYMPIFRSDL